MKTSKTKESLVEDMVIAWQGDTYAPKVEFFSGRIMMYALLKSLGYNPENVYGIKDEDDLEFSLMEEIVEELTK